MPQHTPTELLRDKVEIWRQKSFTGSEDFCDYKIAQADVISMLGATGTITTLGPVTGTDVLNVNGTVNEIRNISGGAAIAVSLNPDDGIDIDFSIDVDATGAPLMLNSTSATPTIVSLVAGNGVTITSVGDTVEIEASQPLYMNYGLLTMQGNATATTISGAGTAALVAGTWTVGVTSNFLGSTAGRLTYQGTTTRYFSVTCSLSVQPSSGSNKNIAVFVAKNGAAIAESKMYCIVSASGEQSITSHYFLSLAQNDYIEVFVTNNTDTTSVVAASAIIQVM